MRLTPREKDKLLVATAAMVARRRLERGVKLNHPEAIALITDAVVEGARDGKSVAHMMQAGAQVLTREQVMDGVAEMIEEIQVEATFSGRDQARHGSPADPLRRFNMIPGEILTPGGDVVLNADRAGTELTVANTGDRPIQVGSHYHFFEVNPALAFDRPPRAWHAPRYSLRHRDPV